MVENLDDGELEREIEAEIEGTGSDLANSSVKLVSFAMFDRRVVDIELESPHDFRMFDTWTRT